MPYGAVGGLAADVDGAYGSYGLATGARAKEETAADPYEDAVLAHDEDGSGAYGDDVDGCDRVGGAYGL